MKDTDKDRDYIGDGVYVANDGFHIILELTTQEPQHRIALEPVVFDALVAYQKRLTEKYEGKE